jgi:hypothetical protein
MKSDGMRKMTEYVGVKALLDSMGNYQVFFCKEITANIVNMTASEYITQKIQPPISELPTSGNDTDNH